MGVEGVEPSVLGCTWTKQKPAAFLKWCAREKIRFPKCEIAVIQGTGRCVVASQDIKQGDVVVEVPDDAVLMAENSPIAPLLEDWGLTKPADEPIMEVQGLILAVMHEKHHNKTSRWGPYMDFLPTDLDHMPMYWEGGELQELKGTIAYDKMQGKVQHPADAPTKVRHMWNKLAKLFISENPDFGLPTGRSGYQLYSWATAVVSSYSFMLGDEHYQAMTPVWDLLNHVTGKCNIRLHHCPRRGVLQMIASTDIAAGQEVINNYGELSNSELLRAYGFFEKHNPYAHVQVPMKFVTQACLRVLSESCCTPQVSETQGGDGFVLQKEGDADRECDGEAEEGVRGRCGGVRRGVGKVGRKVQKLQGDGSPCSDGNGEYEVGGEDGEKEGGSSGGVGKGGDDAMHAALKRTIRERLAFCDSLKLIPKNGVFKVHSGVPPPAALTELIRTLLLSKIEFSRFRSKITSWRIPHAAPLHDMPAVPGPQLPSRVLDVYTSLADLMLRRYAGGNVADDLSLLGGSVSDQALVSGEVRDKPRLHAAVHVRCEEKLCLGALKTLVLERPAEVLGQPQQLWGERLKVSGKGRKRPRENCESDSEDGEGCSSDEEGSEDEGEESEQDGREEQNGELEGVGKHNGGLGKGVGEGFAFNFTL